MKELRWAIAAGKHIQPVVDSSDKTRIGEFLSAAPRDLRTLGSVDFVDIVTTDARYFNLGLEIIREKATTPARWARRVYIVCVVEGTAAASGPA